MAIFGHLVARSLKIRNRIKLSRSSAVQYQTKTLKRLLEKAQHTRFGKHYHFSEILFAPDILSEFQKNIPVHDYSKMWKEWWHLLHEGFENVSWPGKVKYFALSSGTSDSASKHIPVTHDMIKSTQKVGAKQMFVMMNFDVSPQSFEKGILMLGGTTSLNDLGDYYEGDMSGISARNMPKWMSLLFYKPGQEISSKPTWQQRIDLIVRKAKDWDVATVAGVPAWVQIVFEKIIEHHKLETIHDIWPNLEVYIHGGVAFEPYRENFKKLMGKEVKYMETYMASEGSFGFQARPDGDIKLVLNAGIFYEFVPFNETNFTEDGEIKENAEILTVADVKANVNYAILISTVSGAWRYMIGDTLRFTNMDEFEFIISGRTKQFLSICGEHISVDNLNTAIDEVQKQLGITIKEYTVKGFVYDGHFAHQWYIGCNQDDFDAEKVKNIIDTTLCKINDDYAVERESALKDIFVQQVPSETFISYLKEHGKYGAMNKIPRVLKGNVLTEWNTFIEKSKLSNSLV